MALNKLGTLLLRLLLAIFEEDDPAESFEPVRSVVGDVGVGWEEGGAEGLLSMATAAALIV